MRVFSQINKYQQKKGGAPLLGLAKTLSSVRTRNAESVLTR